MSDGPLTERLYRKKPVVIEAVQWNGQNRAELVEFVGEALDEAWSVGGYCFINTLEGRMNAYVGDWIIRGVQGEFYPCKPDIFEATYEAVKSRSTAHVRAVDSIPNDRGCVEWCPACLEAVTG